MARVFVQPNADGTFSTVYEDGGNFEEIYRGTQQMAEQNANIVRETRLGQSTTSPTIKPNPPAAPPAPTGFNTDIWRALTDSNQQQFDEQRRQAERSLYSQLAQGLLSTAASLRGPADWLKYAEYTNGGRNIFQQLFGNTPAPTFGAPSGFSSPATLEDILRRLGLGGDGSGGGSSGGKTIQQMRDELYKASGNMDFWKTAPEAQVIAEYKKLTGYTAPPAAPPTANTQTATATATAPPPPAATAGTTGTAGVAATNPLAAAMQAATLPIKRPPATPGQGQQQLPGPDRIGIPITPDVPRGNAPGDTGSLPPNYAPLPHQINPLVWDALSDTAKQMILAAAEAGRTPSGAWSATDYLSQFNASRPRGIAPRSVSYGFAAPQSYF